MGAEARTCFVPVCIYTNKQDARERMKEGMRVYVNTKAIVRLYMYNKTVFQGTLMHASHSECEKE